MTHPFIQTTFCGRDAELGNLLDLWNIIRDGGPPQIAVLLAESGLGKTRLSHELYQRISASQQPEAAYWPATLTTEGNNLQVNADPQACDPSKPLQFLWWGIRLVDPLSRNCLGAGVLSHHFENDLTPHLEASYRTARGKERKGQVFDIGKGLLIDVAADFIPFAGLAKTVGQAAWDIKNVYKQSKEDEEAIDLTILSRQKSNTLNEQIMRDLNEFFSTHGRIPVAVLIDDAQFSTHDTGIVAFTETLIRNIAEHGWPILLLISHWEKEWTQIADANSPSPNIASIVRKHQGWNGTTLPTHIFRLQRISDLSPMLTAQLPGLSTPQLNQILQRVDGNPRFLDELIRLAKSPRGRGFFQERSLNNPLTDKGLEELLEKGVALHDLISERLATSPELIQQAVALASLQGVEFLTGIVGGTANRLNLDEAQIDSAVDVAESEHAYIAKVNNEMSAFAQRIYFEVAQQHLPSWFDTDEANEALRSTTWDILESHQYRSFSSTEAVRFFSLVAGLFEDDDDPRNQFAAAFALHSLAKASEANLDIYGVYSISLRLNRILNKLPDYQMDGDLEWLQTVLLACTRVGDQTVAMSALNRLLSLTHATYLDDANAWSARMYAQMLVHLADHHHQNGNHSDKIDALRQASAAMTAIDATEIDADFMEVLDQIALGTWEEQLRQGNVDGALETINRNAITIQTMRQLDNDSSRSLYAAARALLYKGDAMAYRRQYIEANEALLEGLEIARNLNKHGTTSDSQRMLINLLTTSGLVWYRLGNLLNASSSLQEATDLAEILFQAAATPDNRELLDRTQNSLEKIKLEMS